jgi:hypothetical protein
MLSAITTSSLGHPSGKPRFPVAMLRVGIELLPMLLPRAFGCGSCFWIFTSLLFHRMLFIATMCHLHVVQSSSTSSYEVDRFYSFFVRRCVIGTCSEFFMYPPLMSSRIPLLRVSQYIYFLNSSTACKPL